MNSRLAFLIMITLVFFYSYILGGAGSMLIIYILILAWLISTILTALVAQKLKISISIPTVSVEKDGKIPVLVYVENKSWIPIPFIDISFIKTPNFTLSEASVIRISLGAHESQTVEMSYRGKIRGITKIGVKNIEIRDYIGLFSFSLIKEMSNQDTTKDVTVIPKIYHINPNSKIVLNSNQIQKKGAFGEPGYEFREYIPGDSLHRIHWKLSAKKDILMVRMSEAQGVRRKKFLIIDPYIPSSVNTIISKIVYYLDDEEKLLMEEVILETLLSIAGVMIKADIDVELYLYENSKWVNYQIKDTSGINQLQYKLAQYKFTEDITFNQKNRVILPNVFELNGRSSSVSGGEAVVFTGFIDEILTGSINQYLDNKMLVDTILIKRSSENTKSFVQENLWVLSMDKNFTEVFS